MNMTVDQQFTTLSEKLQQLLRQYSRLQKENERLKEELQQQVGILKLASGEMDEKDKKQFERKINQYLREIDKCISFLSQ